MSANRRETGRRHARGRCKNALKTHRAEPCKIMKKCRKSVKKRPKNGGRKQSRLPTPKFIDFSRFRLIVHNFSNHFRRQKREECGRNTQIHIINPSFDLWEAVSWPIFDVHIIFLQLGSLRNSPRSIFSAPQSDPFRKTCCTSFDGFDFRCVFARLMMPFVILKYFLQKSTCTKMLGNMLTSETSQNS